METRRNLRRLKIYELVFLRTSLTFLWLFRQLKILLSADCWFIKFIHKNSTPREHHSYWS